MIRNATNASSVTRSRFSVVPHEIMRGSIFIITPLYNSDDTILFRAEIQCKIVQILPHTRPSQEITEELRF